MPHWDSGQYLKFEEERTQPCRDLAARIELAEPESIIDLGCGPGNSTEVIARRFPRAALTGLDSSAAMIAAARERHPEWRWVEGGIAEWAEGEERFDLVFSNAALQWVEGHERVFPRLLHRAARALALQMPANPDAPAHRAARELGRRFGIAERVREWRVHDENFYYDLLAPLCARLDIWSTEYLHVMADAAAIVEWYRGTGLRPFLEALPDDDGRRRFLAEYHARVQEDYPPRPGGRVLFPFRRLFLVAYR